MPQAGVRTLCCELQGKNGGGRCFVTDKEENEFSSFPVDVMKLVRIYLCIFIKSHAVLLRFDQMKITKMHNSCRVKINCHDGKRELWQSTRELNM